jgi:hypothetical protein
MNTTNIFTPAALKKWAYKKSNQELPVQLNELGIAVENSDLLISFVVDERCPKRATILGFLYSLIGKNASKHLTSDNSLINILLSKAELNEHPIIKNWVARSRIIMNDMRKYDYVEWCEGGFARKDL